jgi:DNA-binding NtrC family response regulator
VTSDTASRPSLKVSRKAGAPARLFVVFPLEHVAEHDLPPGTVTLGREGATLNVPVPTVSKSHLRLEWDARAGAHVVTDLGSKHGTTVDGAPLEEPAQALANQSVLRLGDAVLVYEQLGLGATGLQTEALPGKSQAMARLRDEVERAGREATTVLVTGAPGVGKETVASELHRLSGRKGPFIPIHVGALSEDNVERHLVDHLVNARGGTVLLDEVSELPLELQPRLLRAIQHREVLPEGGTTPVKLDVLIIADTTHDLASDVEQRTFRRDLHARLSLWELRVPPLGERRADVVPWIRQLQREWAEARGADVPPLALDAETVEAIVRAALPENVRTLDRLVHLMGARGTCALDALPAWLFQAARPQSAAPLPAKARGKTGPVPRRASPTKEELLATLERLGSVRATAKHYERDRKQIYRWIEAYGLTWNEAEAP